MNQRENLWIIRPDSDSYATLKQKGRSENWMQKLNMLKAGGPLLESWEPVLLELYQDENREQIQLPVPDFTMGVVTIAMSATALELLQPLVYRSVEFLPLLTPFGPYYEMNVNRVDCLDVSNSIVKRYDHSGLVMSVQKYSFHWDKLNGVHIFLLPELGLSTFFVSNRFKLEVKENNLTGLDFFPVPLLPQQN